jgi:3-isopropylmalate/(R)-2-methylmalate dehydratase large subunit
MVAKPHLPSNTQPAAELNGTAIDQVVIGSCTNGRIEDLRQAAEVLRGRRVHKNVRIIVIPATQAIWRQANDEGLFDVFIDAEAAVSAPTCGPCLGGHMGVLAEGERAVSTTNRNFVGRMGHIKSEVYLAGPYVAAASAVAGYIATPEQIGAPAPSSGGDGGGGAAGRGAPVAAEERGRS